QYKSFDYGYETPTPLKTLYNAYEIAREVGLKYVYLGNLPNTRYEHTICPDCSNIVIKRVIFGISELNLDNNGKCKFCGFSICKM
ncbi:MAG: AmmeMemoRadiSam system radical SAM enzyme, partial [Candidatus Hodarchaeota archaeon]